DGVAPDGGEQVVLRDEALGMLDEMAQGRERLRREIQQSLATPCPLGLRFDANRRPDTGACVAHPPRHSVSNPWLLVGLPSPGAVTWQTTAQSTGHASGSTCRIAGGRKSDMPTLAERTAGMEWGEC